MPVKLPQSTGLQGHNRCGQSFGNGEIAGIHNGDGTSASGRRGWWILRQLIYVGAVAFEFTIRARNFSLTNLFFQNIRSWRRDVIEDGCVHTKISRQYILGGMNDPIVHGKGCTFILC